jgi:sensor histidine kinase YesM
MSSLSLKWLNKKSKIQIAYGALFFWLIVGVTVYLTELVAHFALGEKFIDEVEKKQYIIRILLWAILYTPLIIYFALKINFHKNKTLQFILLHIVIGTLIIVSEFIIEVSIMKPIAERVYEHTVLVKEFALPFVYKYWAYIAIYFLMIGIIKIIVYINKFEEAEISLYETELKNKELQYQLTLSQLNSLKMQLQPHFLFNTHNSIISLMLQNENVKAIKMLTKLSSLLRFTLDKSNLQTLTLKEEVDCVNLYLEIQHIRFQDRLKIESVIPENLMTIQIPAFILQPLVENAIQHGIAPYSDAGLISLTAILKDGYLRLIISDDGQGISTIKEGIGLSNTRNRLKQLYGNNYKLVVTNNPDKGASSIIEIPVK